MAESVLSLEEVEVTPLRPERFAEVLTPEALAAFERTLARGRELLGSNAIWNVNSTAFGGGVAEMLRSLIGYVARGGTRRSLGGLDGRRRVLPHHQAPAQPAARGAGRRRAARRGGTPRVRAPVREQTRRRCVRCSGPTTS